MIEDCDIVWEIVGSIKAKALMLPFHEPIGLRYMVLLLVGAVGIVGIAGISIADVQQWRFQPATKDGQPVAVQISVEVSFKLY